jgi:hypothetical protein
MGSDAMGSSVLGEGSEGIPACDFEQDAEFGVGARESNAIAGGRLFDILARSGDSGIGCEPLLLDGSGYGRGHFRQWCY